MKFIYIALLFVSVALNGYLLFNKSHSGEGSNLQEKAQERNVYKVSVVESEVGNEIAQLKQKLSLAEKEIQNLKQESQNASYQPEELASDFKTDLDSTKRNEYVYEDIEKKNQAKAKQYQTEQVDPDWAYDSEEHISSMITNSDLNSDLSLQGILCKTTMCKLTVIPYKDTDKESIAILMGVSMLAFESPRFRDYHTRSIPNEETGELDIYFYPADEESE
ncbi:hypothetical protein [Kangiella koreensis]|uniref:Uncharacterized protein n=1 Tax=Kangiella koreensis (strain DSM 16069 / JCM 12317 / KCTC 12182 / SW-125) TaxID=523791 RepID=C7R8W6_KANKD|nr:hypothetical protein [Kangiella koreensis]ACV25979.1 hypothetical protein Kkor_0559 [Kangiella koreensis DSM 16069]